MANPNVMQSGIQNYLNAFVAGSMQQGGNARVTRSFAFTAESGDAPQTSDLAGKFVVQNANLFEGATLMAGDSVMQELLGVVALTNYNQNSPAVNGGDYVYNDGDTVTVMNFGAIVVQTVGTLALADSTLYVLTSGDDIGKITAVLGSETGIPVGGKTFTYSNPSGGITVDAMPPVRLLRAEDGLALVQLNFS